MIPLFLKAAPTLEAVSFRETTGETAIERVGSARPANFPWESWHIRRGYEQFE